MRQVLLLLLGDVAEMTPNRKMHYRERDRLRDKWKLLAISEWNRLPRSMFAGPVRISYHVFRGRALDVDNLSSSLALKAIQDALKGKAYPDDSPRYVSRGTVTQESSGCYRACPAVEVLIEEVD